MTSRISDKAKKSVVIVADKSVSDAYGSGCVVMKNNNTVTVVTSSKLVQGRENSLKVIFSDRTKLDATVVAHKESFCFLTTSIHRGCEVIDLFEDEHGPDTQTTFMFVPQSRTTTRKMSTFVTAESLESYMIDETDLAANSVNYFMVSCSYFEKFSDGINRLTAAPVFTMTGRTVGIVLQDCRRKHEEDEEDEEDEGDEEDEEDVDSGAEMKVVLKATHLRALMMSLGH